MPYFNFKVMIRLQTCMPQEWRSELSISSPTNSYSFISRFLVIEITIYPIATQEIRGSKSEVEITKEKNQNYWRDFKSLNEAITNTKIIAFGSTSYNSCII